MSLLVLTQQGADPAAPSASSAVFYFKTDDRVYWREDDGDIHKLAHSGEAETFLGLTVVSVTATGNVSGQSFRAATLGSSPGNNGLYGNSTTGLTFQASSGSLYDVTFISPGNVDYIMRVPTGTLHIEVPNGTVIHAASTTARAGARLPHGTAPTSPIDGDEWTTTAGKFIRINGVTKQFTLT